MRGECTTTITPAFEQRPPCNSSTAGNTFVQNYKQTCTHKCQGINCDSEVTETSLEYVRKAYARVLACRKQGNGEYLWDIPTPQQYQNSGAPETTCITLKGYISFVSHAAFCATRSPACPDCTLLNPRYQTISIPRFYKTFSCEPTTTEGRGSSDNPILQQVLKFQAEIEATNAAAREISDDYEDLLEEFIDAGRAADSNQCPGPGVEDRPGRIPHVR